MVQGQVQQLRQLCSNCDHAAFGSMGVWCTFFNEDIWFEEVAEECPEFTPVPWAQSAKGA